MNPDELPISGLTQVTAQVTGRWQSKTVTTDPPRYIPHTEYALVFDLTCSVPVLPVVMLGEGDHGEFARTWRSAATESTQCRLAFFPYDWRHSQQVQVNFEGVRVAIDNAALKTDPRPFVISGFVDRPRETTTGGIITLASVRADQQINARLLLIAKSDTEAKRGRWSLKPDVAQRLPATLGFLTHGQIAGRF